MVKSPSAAFEATYIQKHIIRNILKVECLERSINTFVSKEYCDITITQRVYPNLAVLGSPSAFYGSV